MPRYPSFANFMKIGTFQICNSRGISQQLFFNELGAFLDFSAHTVSRWRRGHIPDNLWHLQFLVAYFITNTPNDKSYYDEIKHVLQSVYSGRQINYTKELKPFKINLPSQHSQPITDIESAIKTYRAKIDIDLLDSKQTQNIYPHIYVNLDNLLTLCHRGLEEGYIDEITALFDDIRDPILWGGRWKQHDILVEYLLERLHQDDLYTRTKWMTQFGWSLALQGKHQESNKLLLNALHLANNLHSNSRKKRHQVAFVNLAVSHSRAENYEQAFNSINHALQIAQERASTRYSIIAEFYKGQFYKLSGKPELAFAIFDKVEKESKKLSWQRAEAYAKNEKADIKLENKIEFSTYREIRNLLSRTSKVAKKFADLRRMAFIQASLAQLELRLERFGIALAFAYNAYQLFKKLNMQPEQEQIKCLILDINHGISG